MPKWLETFITVLCAVMASSGFWTYIQKKNDKKDAKTQVLLGLGHDRIVYLGMKYIERGYIYQDEFEDLDQYLYKPYVNLGGNGSAKRVMDEVYKLEIRNPHSTLSNKEK